MDDARQEVKLQNPIPFPFYKCIADIKQICNVKKIVQQILFLLSWHECCYLCHSQVNPLSAGLLFCLNQLDVVNII